MYAPYTAYCLVALLVQFYICLLGKDLFCIVIYVIHFFRTFVVEFE